MNPVRSLLCNGALKNVSVHAPPGKGPQEKQKQTPKQNRTRARKDSRNNDKGQLEDWAIYMIGYTAENSRYAILKQILALPDGGQGVNSWYNKGLHRYCKTMTTKSLNLWESSALRTMGHWKQEGFLCIIAWRESSGRESHSGHKPGNKGAYTGEGEGGMEKGCLSGADGKLARRDNH